MHNTDVDFRILALAPFTITPQPAGEHLPLAVDRHSLDDAMAALGIEFYLPLDGDQCRSGGTTFRFDSLKSLHPDGMAKGNTFLRQLNEAGSYLKAARREGRSPEDIAAGLSRWPDLPPVTIKADRPQKAKKTSQSAVDNILDMVSVPGESTAAPPVHEKAADPIRSIEQSVLEALFNRREFRRTEAAWRGLRLLLQQGIPQGSVNVEIVNVHPETMASVLEALTPALMEHPPGLILLDLPLDGSPLSLERMTTVAQWAATLMVPVVAWASAGMLQIDHWRELDRLPFIPNHLAGPAYAKFQALKSSDAGHWLCLTVNRFLIRYPYGPDNTPRTIAYTERKPLWIPPVWAVGTLIAQSADSTGWPTRFTDRRRFHVQDLALDPDGHTPPVAVETPFTRDRLDQFTRAGITPLTAQPGTDSAFVAKAVTVSESSLAYHLTVSRVTAFVLWCKDNLPPEDTPDALETQLRLAFQVFSERSRPAAFDDIKISALSADSDGGIPVQLSLTLSQAILPGGQVIELTLEW